jgi:hypothetical protein
MDTVFFILYIQLPCLLKTNGKFLYNTNNPSLTQVEAAVTYPLEYAKTRVQLSHARPPRNPFSPLLLVLRTEGARAVYKGCGVLVVGSIGKDAVRFLGFDSVKNAFKDPRTGTLTPARNMLAGMAAGVLASVLAVTPTERIKTALIDDGSATGARRFRWTGDAVKTILKEDGVIGLYRGFAGTTLKQASATSFRMGSYNIIKDFEEAKGVTQSTAMNFVNGSAAGGVFSYYLLLRWFIKCANDMGNSQELSRRWQRSRLIRSRRGRSRPRLLPRCRL